MEIIENRETFYKKIKINKCTWIKKIILTKINEQLDAMVNRYFYGTIDSHVYLGGDVVYDSPNYNRDDSYMYFMLRFYNNKYYISIHNRIRNSNLQEKNYYIIFEEKDIPNLSEIIYNPVKFTRNKLINEILED